MYVKPIRNFADGLHYSIKIPVVTWEKIQGNSITAHLFIIKQVKFKKIYIFENL